MPVLYFANWQLSRRHSAIVPEGMLYVQKNSKIQHVRGRYGSQAHRTFVLQLIYKYLCHLLQQF